MLSSRLTLTILSMKKFPSLPDCRACHYSIAKELQNKQGQRTYALYCRLFEGYLYAPCPEFVYEPGTDLSEMPT
jgi:hypothetical protein